MDIFSQVRNNLQSMGLIREISTFVDASQLISRLTTWDDRDRAIRQGLEQFNNETVGKAATDKQACFGCAHGFQHVCPNGGAVYADKGYGLNPVKITLKRKGCHDGTIKKTI